MFTLEGKKFRNGEFHRKCAATAAPNSPSATASRRPNATSPRRDTKYATPIPATPVYSTCP